MTEKNIIQSIVYSDRAMVTREAKEESPEAEGVFVFEELPADIEQNSIKIKAFSASPVRILGTEIEEVFLEEVLSEKLLKIQSALKEVDEKLEWNQRNIERLTLQKQNLANLRKKLAGERLFDFNFAKLSFEELKNEYEWIREEDFKTIDIFIRLEKEKKQLNLKRNALLLQAGAIKNEEQLSTLHCKIFYTSEGNEPIRFQLSYMIPNAQWEPFYDLRLFTQKAELEIAAYAAIQQISSEDWNETDLYLSTANPAMELSLPEPSTWFVSFNSWEATSPLRQENPMSSIGTVNYHVPGKVNIPSEAKSHKILLGTLSLAVETEYVVHAKHTQKAFVKVITKNESDFAFLKGESSVFHESDYLGKSEFPETAPGGPMELYMGIEEDIKIDREELNRFTEKKGFGNNHTKTTYEYKITVENLKNEAISLKVYESLPVPQNSDIKVKVEKSEPEYTEKDEKNFIQWAFNLASSEKKEIFFHFSVEYPVEKTLTGI